MVALPDTQRFPASRRGVLSRRLGRVLREPLVHFLLLGGLIFLLILGVRALQRPTVRIDAQDINQLVEYWQLQSQRAPTKAELSAIVQDRVDEELLAREALRLGMDKGDLIIRRRLAQKMSFASEDLSMIEPSAETLKVAYEATKARYVSPEKVALRQVFFSADRGTPQAEAAALGALTAIQRGEPAADGDPSLLPLAYADANPDLLSRDYGAPFAALAAKGPIGRWLGPVKSPLGVHLLYIETRQAGVAAPFEAVRDQVRDAYLSAERRTKTEEFMQKLRRKYRVEVAGATP